MSFAKIGPEQPRHYVRDDDPPAVVNGPASENLRIAAGKRGKARKLIDKKLAPELPQRCADDLAKVLDLLSESARQQKIAEVKIEHVADTAALLAEAEVSS